MSAFAKDSTVIFFRDLTGCFDHSFCSCDLHSGQYLRLRNVRSQKIGQRKEFIFQNIDCCLADQSCTAGCHHNRVNYDVFCLISAKFPGDHLDQVTFRNHSDLYCVRKNIVKNRIQFLTEKFSCCILDRCNTGCILCCQCCDSTHCIDTVCHHGFDISLDTCSSAGIAACYG